MGSYLISTGGVGSEALESFLGRANINDEGRCSAHERDPRFVLDGSRVLYLFGNPYNKLLSYYHRGFLHKPYIACLHLRGKVNEMAARDEWTLSQYLDNGVDFFQIAEHFNGWFNYADRKYEILFARYCSMQQNTKQILSWLGFGDRGEFRFAGRRSDWTTESNEIKAGLVRMYGKHKEFIDSLPDIFTMNGTTICAV